MEFDKLDQILARYQQEGYYPSAVCQVFDKTDTLYHRALGQVTEDTWFDLASVSKIICTTMLLFAMEEGRLTPEDRVLDLLEEAPAVTPVTDGMDFAFDSLEVKDLTFSYEKEPVLRELQLPLPCLMTRLKKVV